MTEKLQTGHAPAVRRPALRTPGWRAGRDRDDAPAVIAQYSRVDGRRAGPRGGSTWSSQAAIHRGSPRSLAQPGCQAPVAVGLPHPLTANN